MDLKLKGKTCIITGGSRGIGRAIALGLAAEGAHVAFCARGEDALRATEAELRKHGGKVYAATCDVGDRTALEAFMDDAHDALGGTDILVHNASALAVGPDRESWDASLRVDVMAAVTACDKAIPRMAANGGGAILLVSSISGLEADPSPGYAYAAAKAALIAYAKKLAMQLAPQGIRCNAIAPGSIEFEGGVWDMVKQHEPALYGMVLGSIPSGRLGTPEEVADAAVWLVSPRANWVTGECLSVDGGQHRGMR